MLLGRWLPGTGAAEAAPTPTLSLVWYPLDWCHKWRVFKYLICPVCPRKKGLCWCDCFSNTKLGKEEGESGDRGGDGQIAMRKWAVSGRRGQWREPEKTAPPVITELSPESVARLTLEDKEASTMWLLLTIFNWGLTMCQPLRLAPYTPHPINVHAHPTQGLIITI